MENQFEIYECIMCGEILSHRGKFCSDECDREYRYENRTCSTCGGEFWNGGTSCTCDNEDEDDFKPCDKCDGHDACRDFGCAIEAGLGHMVKKEPTGNDWD